MTDPSLTVTDIDATVEAPSLGVGRSFSLFGKTAQAFGSQAPMGSFQAHVSYNFTRQSWAAVDTTYYVGGRSTVDGVENDDRQNNLRMGSTLVLPIGRRHSVKLAVSRGAIVRAGTDFTTISVGWQTAWLSRRPLLREPGE